MITTIFKTMGDREPKVINITMPFPVREGEYVELDDIIGVVHAVYWIIKTNPETMTRTVELHVGIK